MRAKVSETYVGYTTDDKLEKLLLEATSDDTAMLSNFKLLELADATNNMEQGPKIIKRLVEKLKCPGFEWKRIVKALNAIEFIMKNGNINMVGKLHMDGASAIM